MSYEIYLEGKIIVFKDEEGYYNARLHYLDYCKKLPEGDPPVSFFSMLLSNENNTDFTDRYGVEEIKDAPPEVNGGMNTYESMSQDNDMWTIAYENSIGTGSLSNTFNASINVYVNGDYQETPPYFIGNSTVTNLNNGWVKTEGLVSTESPEAKEKRLKEEEVKKEKNKFNRFDIMELGEEE